MEGEENGKWTSKHFIGSTLGATQRAISNTTGIWGEIMFLEGLHNEKNLQHVMYMTKQVIRKWLKKAGDNIDGETLQLEGNEA
jgi:hypothetical protein